jgi:hypothetical protein
LDRIETRRAQKGCCIVSVSHLSFREAEVRVRLVGVYGEVLLLDGADLAGLHLLLQVFGIAAHRLDLPDARGVGQQSDCEGSDVYIKGLE